MAQPRIYSWGEPNTTRGRETASQIVHVFSITDLPHPTDQVTWLTCLVKRNSRTPHSMGLDYEFRTDVITRISISIEWNLVGENKKGLYQGTTSVSNMLRKGRGW